MPLLGDGSHVCTACRRGLRGDDKVCPSCGGRNVVPNDGGVIKLFGGTTFTGPQAPLRDGVTPADCPIPDCQYCYQNPKSRNDHHDASHGDGHPDYAYDPNRDVHHLDAPHGDAHTDIPLEHRAKNPGLSNNHADTPHGDASLTGRDAFSKGLKEPSKIKDELKKLGGNFAIQQAVARAIQGAVLPRLRRHLEDMYIRGPQPWIGHGDEIEFVTPLTNEQVAEFQKTLGPTYAKKEVIRGFDPAVPGSDRTVYGMNLDAETIRDLRWGRRLLAAMRYIGLDAWFQGMTSVHVASYDREMSMDDLEEITIRIRVQR